MEPEFSDGDLVLIEAMGTATAKAVAEGDVVVARHPFKNLDVIKYVSSVDADDHLVLRSPSGDDSRQFGRVPTGTVKGKVTVNLTAARHNR